MWLSSLVGLLFFLLNRSHIRRFSGLTMASPLETSNVHGIGKDPKFDTSDEKEQIPLLPPPNHDIESEGNPPSSSSGVQQIKIGGEAFKMDHLGPIIINSDGTTRRIANWETLSKHEQETTWRLISARNKKRLEELKKQQAEAAEESITAATPGEDSTIS